VIPAFAGSLPVKGNFGGNVSVTVQSGTNNAASVNVTGAFNFTTVAQSGEGHTFSQSITGSNQTLSVIQMNSHNYEGTRTMTSTTPSGSSTYTIQVTPRAPD
jgi:hypothetical protein